jgi:hypothetical protein
MINYFDYYNLDYESLYNNAQKYKFINDVVKNEYFLGIERGKNKIYENLNLFQPLDNIYPKGSPKWITQEIKNCKTDILHFCQYLKILDPTDSFIPYKPYLYQQEYYRALNESKYVISDKCRQIGFSVGTYIYLLHQAMFKKDQRIDIISINDDLATSFLKKLKGTYDSMEDWIKMIPFFQKTKDGGNNEHTFSLQNGSMIKSLPRRKEGARSSSLSILVFDEAAFIEYMDLQWRGSYASIAKSEKSKAIIISTRNGNSGVGGWYYDKLTSTQNGETDFTLVEANWWEVPEYLVDPAWLDGHWKNTSRDSFLQEVCKKWIISGETVLSKEKLLGYKVKEPISNKIINIETGRSENIEGLAVFEIPASGVKDERDEYIDEPNRYAIVADVGTGSAKSFSSFHIFNLDNNEQVAEYKRRITTNEYAKLLIKVSKYYNEAIIVFERNNPGEAICSDIINVHKYKNVFKRVRKRVSYKDWGWTTTTKTRPLIINSLIEDFENDNIKINGKRTIDESLTFIWNEKTQKPEAATGSNDDLIISLAIYCYLKERLIQDSAPKTHIMRGDDTAKTKIWDIIYDTDVEHQYREYYWLYGKKTREKINKRFNIEKPKEPPVKKRGRPIILDANFDENDNFD